MLHAPLPLAAATFILCHEKDASFPGALSKRCNALAPLLVYRIGGIINHLAYNGIIDQRAAVGAVTGNYPNMTLSAQHGSTDAIISVQNALQAMKIQANLQAAMSCVVGIQDSMLALGVDKIMGAANTTLSATYSAYKVGAKTYDYSNKAVSAGQKIAQLRDFINKQKGKSVDIFISAL